MLEEEKPKARRTFFIKKLKKDIEHSRSMEGRGSTIHMTGGSQRNFTNVLQKFRAVGQTAKSLSTVTGHSRKDGGASIPLSRRESEIEIISEVQGPSLSLDRSQLSFVEHTNRVASDCLTLSNNGTTAIYYKWRRVEIPIFYRQTIQDQEERFFCYYVSPFYGYHDAYCLLLQNKNVIKPGEKKTFFFSFKSSITGVFNEEWALECEPALVSNLPNLQLSGNAYEDDGRVNWYVLTGDRNSNGAVKIGEKR